MTWFSGVTLVLGEYNFLFFKCEVMGGGFWNVPADVESFAWMSWELMLVQFCKPGVNQSCSGMVPYIAITNI